MPDIEKHLHQLSHLIRDQDSIKLVVRLESSVLSRIRYLAVVSCIEQEAEEFCLLGIDCEQSISLGLVLAILSYTTIRLDGDGGFCVTTGDGLRSHIFKPVSVQTMWSALQSLYRASECAKENNSFQACAVRYYEGVFSSHKSDPNCLTEWNILPGIENRRPLASSFTTEELSFQEQISCCLREILLCEKDLDEVTSKEIRTKLEYKLRIDLSNYKSFIDEEMLKILGQMEAPALILDHLYLGTEWNASHQQDLFDKQINYILNVTTEIDNFFPDTFRYMNIPVCDTEETDILRYFNDSYRFINKARKDGKNVLVHCKMGISRSATIVIAYVMKIRNWDLSRSLKHVKERRNCVKPNPNFMKQLEIYEGILTAKRYSSTLEKRSKSESNLKQTGRSPITMRSDRTMCSSNSDITDSGVDGKLQKKYFHTAPARLKPEKCPTAVTELLGTKSSSCAAIELASVNHPLDDIVSQEVLNSFEEAVNSFEQRSSHTSISSEELVTVGSKVSIEIPMITITGEEHVPVSSVETEQMCIQSRSEDSINSNANEAHISTQEVNALTLIPAFHSSDEQILNQSETAECHISDECNKFMNLKCCRRPYNGHTFSVSPNQVVNITSLVDYSKFSVRHLVNEFELQSNRFNQNSLPYIDINASSAEPLSLQLQPMKSVAARGKVRKLLERGDSDCSSEDNQDIDTRKIIPEKIDERPTTGHVGKSLKKVEKLSSGCLPFFRKYASSSKGSFSKNSVSPGTGLGLKKSSGEKYREKPRDKGVKCKGKILETVAKLSETGDNVTASDHLPAKYQSTGVVKQRLEAFEAKALPNFSHSKQFFRSHNRSLSATGGTNASLPFDTLGLGPFSQRKSSMPHLESRNLDCDFSSFPQRNHPVHISNRKASLDSNSLFKSFPCVRGFQSSGSKSFFSTSPNTTTRQQHGSTHPLNLLPRTTTTLT